MRLTRLVLAAAVMAAVFPAALTSATPLDPPAREVEPVVLTGAQLPGWSGPAARGVAKPYPSGALDGVRDAHNGTLITPPQQTWSKIDPDSVVAFSYSGGTWTEVPVQVDERFPYFLANANSDFATYSGTDEELTYEWDVESWKKTAGECFTEYPAGESAMEDPVLTLDDDDEVVFMASDAGERAPASGHPEGVTASRQEVRLADPRSPGADRFVYLYTRAGGSTFDETNGYVRYERDANADQWIDRSFFTEDDPEKLGTSNRGYGPNLAGTVCEFGTDPTTGEQVVTKRMSDDRFPRDGVTVTTASYKWRATGRWMIRSIQVAAPTQVTEPAPGSNGKGGNPCKDGKPGNGSNPGNGNGHNPCEGKPHGEPSAVEPTPPAYGPDLIDRWKGRAFQQSPDSSVSLVGFEDEQVNWEGNATLLGELTGPVRAIREVWGADSGTNVTKTETFYRDVITYRFRVRVHPIPPDGLYTSWDYNHDQVGTYYNEANPQGVPIDGVNDELIGNIDQAPNGDPFFIDVPDPTFTRPLAFFNWEQVSGKDNSGSLVYMFELKNAQSLENPLVVPYYRDDACLDDGTGDDPTPRAYPGESYEWMRNNNKGTDYLALPCKNEAPAGYSGPYRQGAFGSHGIHYFITNDTDNAFTPLPLTEIDGQQWQWMVPTEAPEAVGDRYANTVKTPLIATAVPQG